KSPWFMGFRDITNATNERTFVSAAFPRSAVSNKLPIFLGLPEDKRLVSALLANLSTFVFDFSARQKIGGTTMNFYIVKQLPVLPPETYTEDLLDRIVPRVLELTYTAWDMQPFARDLG